MNRLFNSLSFLAAKAALLVACAAWLANTPASASTVLSSGINLGQAGPDQHNRAIFSLGDDSLPNGEIIANKVKISGAAKVTRPSLISL